MDSDKKNGASLLKIIGLVLMCPLILQWAWEKREFLHYFLKLTPELMIANLLIALTVFGVSEFLRRTNQEIFGFSIWRILLWVKSSGKPDRTKTVWRIGENIHWSIIKSSGPFAIVPILAVISSLPYVVHWEEEIFRGGTSNWIEGIARSVVFGLLHMTMGIPLSVAIALIIPGLWLTHWYFVGGVDLSTLHHLSYDVVWIGGVAILSIILACKKGRNR